MFEAEFFNEESQLGLIIEDDGEVAYAYFCEQNGTVIGLVWLWNHGAPPKEFEGTRGKPLRNPQPYVIGNGPTPPASADELLVTFQVRDGNAECGIYLNNKLLAIVGRGLFPGRNVFAARANDFAMPWPEKNTVAPATD